MMDRLSFERKIAKAEVGVVEIVILLREVGELDVIVGAGLPRSSERSRLKTFSSQ
jgi:hypothetical protein